MNNFQVYKTVHFPDEWAKQITAAHHKEHATTKGTYMYYNVFNMNQDPKHIFYILGVLDNNVIASCFVQTYLFYDKDERIDHFDEFLISYLIVDKDYQKQGYGTKFLNAVIQILKEDNAIKICAFACDNSKKLFENFGFIKDEKIKSFGMTVPGDDTDVYYELNLEGNFFLAPVNKDDAWFIASSMHDKLWSKMSENSDLPFSLFPSVPMYKQDIINKATYDNAIVKTVRCNRMACGYTYMYYHDYDTDFGESHHYVTLTFYLMDNYLYKNAIKVIVDEAIKFYNETKEKHNVQFIKVELNKWTILMERYSFYRRCLLELGFRQQDKELFILEIE